MGINLNDIKKTMTGAAKTASDFAKDKIPDALDTIKYRADDIIRNARDVVQCVRHGYTYTDLWNICDDIVNRYAKLLEVMGSLDYGEKNRWYNRGLRSVSETLAYYSRWEDMYDSILLNGNMPKDERRKLLDNLTKDVNDSFMLAWQWIGANVMSRSAPKPVTSDNEIACRVKAVTGKVTSPLMRALVKYDMSSVTDFQVTECRRLAEMLGTMAEKAHSYPCSYGEKPHLSECDDFASNSYWNILDEEYMKEQDDGSYRVKTNEEVGIEYAAWTNDLNTASHVLKAYADWVLDGTRSEQMFDSPIGVRIDDEAVMDGFKTSFDRVWRWLGEHINDLWD